MNPRYRRLLIPGLLSVLIAVVLIASLAREARGATTPPGNDAAGVVSTINDPRIVESSGLALSVAYRDLAYTINDSGNAPIVFAIELSTGNVLGSARLRGVTLRDPEALAIDAGGTLWIADTGDNQHRRNDAALYAVAEPGPRERVVTAVRYPIAYSAGRPDVEALLVQPRTGEKFLVSKAVLGGRVFRLPRTLSDSRANVAEDLGRTVPALITDGAVTPDGRFAVLRNYGVMTVHDLSSWQVVGTHRLPAQPQGETLAVEASGRSAVVGSEGRRSQLLRVGLDPVDASRESPSRTRPLPAPKSRLERAQWWWYGAPVLVLVGAAALVVAKRN